jgi:hypothetical protein
MALGLVPSAAAQEPADEQHRWFNMSAVVFPYPAPFNMSGGFTYQLTHRHKYQVGLNGSILPSFGFFAAHAAIGKSLYRRKLVTSGFIGPALIISGDDEQDSSVFPAGLVVNLQPIVYIAPELGIGIELFGITDFDRIALTTRFGLTLSNR